jgi:hypothetical protein
MDILREGQKIWLEQGDGSQRAAIFVGEAEASWFGGAWRLRRFSGYARGRRSDDA